MTRDQNYGTYVGGAPSYFTPVSSSSIASGTYFSGLVLNIQPRCPLFGASSYQYNGTTPLYSTKRFSKLKVVGCPKMQAGKNSVNKSLKIPMCRIRYGGYSDADSETSQGNYVTDPDSTTYNSSTNYSDYSQWATKLTQVTI